MISMNYAENRPGAFREYKQADREARKCRARQTHETALVDHDTATAYASLIGSARLLMTARRYRDAHTVLMTALGMTMRLHFMLLNGKDDAADLPTDRYAQKLRSSGAIDAATFQQIMLLVRQAGPFGPSHIERLAEVVRQFYQWTYEVDAEAVV